MKQNFLTKYFLFVLIFSTTILPQGLGEIADEKEPEIFPDNSFGVDLLFGEGGFGLGTFYRTKINSSLTAFADFSISEAKDEKEFEFVDFYGRTIVLGKKNRILLMPLNVGVQQRLFSNVLGDNLRPYLNAGVGPSYVVTTPYEHEFFKSLKYAQGKFTIGGYFGFGANFGLDKKNLVGINLRYYIIHFFNAGVESLYNNFKKDLGGFYLTINIGTMY